MHDSKTRSMAVVHYLHFHRSLRKVSRKHGVSPSSLSRWVRAEAVGTASPRPRRTKRHTQVAAAVSDILQADPFCNLDGVVGKLRSLGVPVSRATACRAVRTAGYTRKRARSRLYGRDATPDDAGRFLDGVDGSAEVISVDETCVYLEDEPRYGYSLKGTRCVHRRKNPSRRTGKVSLLLAISNLRGVVAHTTKPGSFDSKSFASFVKGLPAVPEGTPLILDNVAFHKSAAAREAARSRGCRLVFIPPYSPDFNPVENAFSVLKQALRAGAGVSDALEALTATKCHAFFSRTMRMAESLRASGNGMADQAQI